jgi:hypothetical protein
MNKELLSKGCNVSRFRICQADRIWSRYSNDKIDIGEQLACVIRVLSKNLPLKKRMRALSVGSSAEPQFRLLETSFRGGLYLLDLDGSALDIVKERVQRQYTRHVSTVCCNYNTEFLGLAESDKFRKKCLSGKKVELITLHHSLYYSREDNWHTLFRNLYKDILSPKGAIHAVLMAADDPDPNTTTWLYNHFAGKFFGLRNDQNIIQFAKKLRKDPLFKAASIKTRTDRVKFMPETFEEFMAVVWMVLLYPDVHKYTRKQREEITRYVHDRFWAGQKPLVQAQDHLVIYRGMKTI